jgi:hypothetical protein
MFIILNLNYINYIKQYVFSKLVKMWRGVEPETGIESKITGPRTGSL